MRVFIDTNALLEIYQFSGPDLDELSKLVNLVKTGKVVLLVPHQVVDEFWRNREGVIADTLRQFSNSKAQVSIPNIVRVYPAALELKNTVTRVNEMVKELTAQATSDIKGNSLKADQIIGDLFKNSRIEPISDEILSRARVRVDLGNPPGKKGSMGDAINWEWLLQNDLTQGDGEIVIVSGDGDFESELNKGKPKEFLLREWRQHHQRNALSLDKSLNNFLKREFPDIHLADETEKLAYLERLETAWNFKATHQAVAFLAGYDDFRDHEVQRILRAFLKNAQIRWILGDDDVKAFAHKIIGLARTEASAELATELQYELANLDTDPES